MLILCDELRVGDVGYIAVLIKIVRDIRVGDMIIDVNNLVDEFLLGFRRLNLMVFCGIYLIGDIKYEELKEVLEKF